MGILEGILIRGDIRGDIRADIKLEGVLVRGDIGVTERERVGGGERFTLSFEAGLSVGSLPTYLPGLVCRR